ncbi:MAG: prepilin-type N-terminal cleavage/methylation domain-containing protein [Phycisphaerales bacterium]|nr:prepilin-type N-terminal cleavage/methylation domain-containing protein [Phycisphaerales bacterium]
MSRRRFILCSIAMLIVLLLGLAKFMDLPVFADALRSWTLIPKWGVPLIAIGIPALEIVGSLSWLLGMQRQRAGVFVFGLVGTMTIAYLIQRFLSGPPTCGCVGILANYMSKLETLNWVLGRNVVLLAVIGWSLMSGKSVSTEPIPSAAHAGREAARGFTLIETLVVVAIVGLLIALLAPSLSHVRDRARIGVTLSNLRSHASIFTAYAGDYKDVMPAATFPTGISIVRCQSQGIAAKALYFDMSQLWFLAMADGYYSGDPSSTAFLSPLNPYTRGAGQMLGTSYYYACSFLASPEFYNEKTRTVLPQQLRAARLSEVVFPAAKSLLAEYTAGQDWGPPGGAWAAFTDGHAEESQMYAELTHRSGDGEDSQFVYNGHFPADSYPLLHTKDGVRGRDK